MLGQRKIPSVLFGGCDRRIEFDIRASRLVGFEPRSSNSIRLEGRQRLNSLPHPPLQVALRSLWIIAMRLLVPQRSHTYIHRTCIRLLASSLIIAPRWERGSVSRGSISEVKSPSAAPGPYRSRFPICKIRLSNRFRDAIHVSASDVATGLLRLKREELVVRIARRPNVHSARQRARRARKSAASRPAQAVTIA